MTTEYRKRAALGIATCCQTQTCSSRTGTKPSNIIQAIAEPKSRNRQPMEAKRENKMLKLKKKLEFLTNKTQKTKNTN